MLQLVAFAAAGAALPTPAEVGAALAISEMCVDTDGYTLCPPALPVNVKFRDVLCVGYGQTAKNETIARCVYKGARLMLSNGGSKAYGDGAIDLVGSKDWGSDRYTWLPE
jgi:hypothetical protein